MPTPAWLSAAAAESKNTCMWAGHDDEILLASRRRYGGAWRWKGPELAFFSCLVGGDQLRDKKARRETALFWIPKINESHLQLLRSCKGRADGCSLLHVVTATCTARLDRIVEPDSLDFLTLRFSVAIFPPAFALA